MADPVTMTDMAMVGQDLSAIRREQAEQAHHITDVTKDSRFDVASRIADTRESISKQIDALDDTTTAQLITIARESADNRAQLVALGYQVRDGFVTTAKDAEINALKTQLESQKNTQFLADRIGAEGEKTRALINDINDRDTNRLLQERNTELVAALNDGRFWRGRWDDGQWQSLNSRLQAFQSDLADTRQGMVNFGTMAGVGQSSTQNQVR